MGLDVYAGTLTRYYAGAWETVVQKYGREEGVAVEMIRAHNPPDAISDPTEIEDLVTVWRHGLNQALTAHLAEPLDWREGLGPAYFTDKLTWDCYSALLVWAANAEYPGTPLPPVAPEDWTTNPAVERCLAADTGSRYAALIEDIELWLPGGFAFTFRAEDTGGGNVGIASTGSLLSQLLDLNSQTWRADSATISKWRRDAADFGGPLEESARFAFAVFLELAHAANEHQLPMKLDY